MAFDDDFEAAAEAFSDKFAVEVTLYRGSSSTAGVLGQYWDREYETTDQDGLLTTIAARDWLVHEDGYAIDSVAVEPRDGDQLVDASGGIWEVLPIAGRPGHEQYGSGWLVRTKKVAA